MLLLLAAVPLAGCPDSSSTDAGSDAGASIADASAGDATIANDAFVPADAYVRPAAPALYTESTLEDLELAREALRILGAPAAGGSASCGECHSLTRRQMATWASEAQTVRENCLTDLAVSSDESAQTMLECIRGEAYRAQNISIFAAASDLGWFRYVFEHGSADATEGTREHNMFVDRAGMPAEGRTPLTQAEFDTVASWFLRGAPRASSILPLETPPTSCSPFISSEVAAHVAELATTGWAARNREAGLLMHGCGSATDPRECLTSLPSLTDTTWGATWNTVPGSTSRLLFTTDYASAYWTRSSADGRFVSHGAGGSSRTIDLARGATITVNAYYDPAFFPDNSAFVWPSRVCGMSVLTSMPTSISLSEAACGRGDFGLYEHVGLGLGGADYWVVSGEFTSDNGGHSATREDPSAGFSSTSRQYLHRMTNTGSTFVANEAGSEITPYEGDSTISPSSRLLTTRMGGADGSPLGYVMYEIVDDSTADRVSFDLREVARYCNPGAKMEFSFDERFMVYHHYVTAADAVSLGFTGEDDPAFAPYLAQGASNVYLVELATGTTTRLTNVGPGQYALFPHFRSDGWLYYLVRGDTDLPGAGERVVATDAVLTLVAAE